MGTEDVVILSGCRTPIGSFGGAFKDVSAVDLGAVAVKEAVRRSGARPDQVDEVILGCILQAGVGMNPARQASIRAGIPETTAMEMTGHRTRSIFKRYAIVDERMLREAGAQLDAAAILQGGKVAAASGKVTALKR